MLKFNPDKKFAQQAWYFVRFFIVIEYSKFLWFVITFTSTSISFNSDFYYLKYWIIVNSFLS